MTTKQKQPLEVGDVLSRIGPQTLLDFIGAFEGYGLIVTDEDLLCERLEELNPEGETRVKFYVSTGTNFEGEVETDLYAIFVDQPLNKSTGQREGYAQIGQHTGIHPDYIAKSRDATAEEYAPLLTELQGIYDNLIVV